MKVLKTKYLEYEDNTVYVLTMDRPVAHIDYNKVSKLDKVAKLIEKGDGYYIMPSADPCTVRINVNKTLRAFF